MASQAKISRIAINKILLATDFSPESQNAFYCASSLAKRYGSTLLLTHVLSPKGPAEPIRKGSRSPMLCDITLKRRWRIWKTRLS